MNENSLNSWLNDKNEYIPNITIDNKEGNNGIIAGIYKSITVEQHTRKMKSLIPYLVETLAELTNLSEEEIDKSYKVTLEELEQYDIPTKIGHNKVIKYKDIINEYSQYGAICEDAFNIIDNSNLGIKGKILKSINLLYKQSKGEYLLREKDSGLSEIDIIRKNADNIIDDVKKVLEERIFSDQRFNLSIEEIDDGLARIICYAFVECKILEKPR